MNVKPKGGLGNAFFGAIFGVITVIAVHGIIAAVNGEDIQLIPTIIFDGNVFEFMGDYLSYFFTTTPGLIYLGITILCYIAATYYVQKSLPEPPKPGVPPNPDIIEHDTSGTMRGWMIGLASAMNFILAYNIYRN